MTEIGVPDPVEPAIEVIPTIEPVPGPVEIPLTVPEPEPDEVLQPA